MDRRSWPWKKKSSDKSEKAALATDSAGSQADKDNYKKPTHVQISVESYNHLNGLEDQLKTCEQQVDTLEDEIKELNDKLSAANSEMTTKDNLVKQHAKVAEEAVCGWEKAEAEALALKNHLETVTLSKLTAEDRASHLDGALKECMRQIRNLKEEHEQKLQDVILLKTKQCDKIKHEFEAKVANLDQELLRAAAENAALSRSLHERSNMVMKISEEKAQAEAEIEQLKSNLDSCEREINSLKYELHMAAKELEIRNEEKNMSMRSAEVANKQHMEGVKKIAKLEAECQRLRGLVRKKLPGPAALAQMKLEVESLGRDYGDSRLRRSPVKPPSPHLSAVPEFSLDNAQKFHKENEFLTERFLAMEEETKMLKEALAKRNSELQASRNLCAKTASRLQSLEAQFHVGNQQKSAPTSLVQVSTDSYSGQYMSKPPSVTSMSEDGNDDDRSCADSWTTSLMSELSLSKKEKSGEKANKTKDVKHLELMDDFLEMEKLACLNPNDVTTISDSPKNKTSEIVNGDVSGEVCSGKDNMSEAQHVLESPGNHISSNVCLSAVDSASVEDQLPLMKLQSKISLLLESTSKNADAGKTLEEIKRVLQDTHDALHQHSVSCVPEEVRIPDDVSCNGQTCSGDASLTRVKEITASQDIKAATETLKSMSQELATAISSIHDFVLFLGKEAMVVHDASSDGNGLNKTIEEFSVSFNKALNGNTSLVDFVFDLSSVLAKASELRFNVLGYKGSEAEIYSPDCIDKVALPENKVLQRESSGERYQNGISSPTSNPEVPDDANMVSSYGSNTTLCKVSLEEYEELKAEKDNVAVDLARCTENLEMTKSQLHETEQLLAEAKSQLTSAQKSNSLAETQLKCMAESYRSLEARAEELETEVNLLRSKAENLENELQDEKRCHWDSLSRCKELEDQLQTKESCSVCAAAAAEADLKAKQESELAAAAEKLAECQETIFLLGKQLNSFRPQPEAVASPNSERSQRGEALGEDEPTTSGMNFHHDFNQADTNATASTNQQRVGSESPMDLYNRDPPCSPDTETSLSRSPINSKYPKHRPTKSTSSSTPLVQTPDKNRGFSRFFSSKGRNGN
ncbi:filament-like plant protein 4 [Euphorbia lathyris]|uniref:filament-like plant protein 4 n=1 Tax=Euphorbia lathyris TaxID=212925 RepID=UPI00331312BE